MIGCSGKTSGGHRVGAVVCREEGEPARSGGRRVQEEGWQEQGPRGRKELACLSKTGGAEEVFLLSLKEQGEFAKGPKQWDITSRENRAYAKAQGHERMDGTCKAGRRQSDPLRDTGGIHCRLGPPRALRSKGG